MPMHGMRHGGGAVALCLYAGAPYSPGALLRSSAGIVLVCTLPEVPAAAAKSDTPPMHEHGRDGMRRAVWEVYRPGAAPSRKP